MAAAAIGHRNSARDGGAALAIRDVLCRINERLEGAVDCASSHDAIRKAERVRNVLVEDGWWTDEETP